MKLNNIWKLITVLVNISFVYSSSNEENPMNIIGGYIAKAGQFPYQVSLRGKRSIEHHFCGGTIISNQFVLTAAHCGKIIKGLHLVDNFYVGAGVTNKSDTKHMVIKQIDKVFVHPNYNMQTVENDICLLQIKGKFRFNKYVKPIKINKAKVKPGTKCTVSGWGQWKETVWRIPDQLKGATVPISNQQSCVANYSIFHTVDLKTMICAGYTHGGTDACAGDSGGPLVCNRKLTGVVSFGIGCAEPDYPGIYTRVQSYIEWIQKTTGNTIKFNEYENY